MKTVQVVLVTIIMYIFSFQCSLHEHKNLMYFMYALVICLVYDTASRVCINAYIYVGLIFLPILDHFLLLCKNHIKFYTVFKLSTTICTFVESNKYMLYGVKSVLKKSFK
jgi:hypothetical protein